MPPLRTTQPTPTTHLNGPIVPSPMDPRTTYLTTLPLYSAPLPSTPPLSPLHLGLCIRSLHPTSEASAAGLLVNSILHSLNGIPLLHTRTELGLEVLWNHFGPALLTLYDGTTMYNTVLFGGLEGIEWKSVGEFAMVTKCYREMNRGDVVLKVDGDMVEYANVKGRLESGGEVVMGVLGKNNREVVVRSKPVDVRAVVAETWWACVGPETKVEAPKRPKKTELQRLASFVAKGGVLSIAKWNTLKECRLKIGSREQQQNITMMSGEGVFEYWDSMVAVVQSMRYQAAGYEMGWTCQDSPRTVDECIDVIRMIVTSSPSNVVEEVLDAHLIQLLGIACADKRRELLELVVDESLNNPNTCRRLYFLLRSFVGVLETSGEEEEKKTAELMMCAQRRLDEGMLARCSEVVSMNGESKNIRRQQSHHGSEPSGEDHEVDTTVYTTVQDTKSCSADMEEGESISMGRCPSPANDESTVPTNKKTFKNGTKGKNPSILRLLKGSRGRTARKDKNGTSPSIETLKQAPSFSFTNVFQKQTSPIDVPSPLPLPLPQTPLQTFDNLSHILNRIDDTSTIIQTTLVKSLPRKMAAYFSRSKEEALSLVTQTFRESLRLLDRFPIQNPVDSNQILTGVDPEECYVLPSAHFPMLLCFECASGGGDVIYRTRVEVVGLKSTVPLSCKANGSGEAYVVTGSVGGVVKETGASELYISPKRPSQREVVSHRWTKNNILIFESGSNWGFPKTLAFKISTTPRAIDSRDDRADDSGVLYPNQTEMGCGFINLCPVWKEVNVIESSATIYLYDNAVAFDEHGDAEDYDAGQEKIQLQIRVSVETPSTELYPHKRLLLYKHTDDLRQELLVIQFIERCRDILKVSGLDLRLKTFRCLPVGARKGFIEWVSGTVPLSQLCDSGLSTRLESASGSCHSSKGTNMDDTHDSNVSIEGMDGGHLPSASWCKYRSLRGFRQKSNGIMFDNPIQDFLRAAGYEEDAPYFITKDVMDNYVKSCAGYCVVTYLLGVGDRHLDNILLHQNGQLLHCDFSFILGHDPKTYLPMRITDEMIRGFGGRDSDNFARFLSFTGAAFLTLRTPHSVRALLSQIRTISQSKMNVSPTQSLEDAVWAMRGRFKLELSDDDALSYIEQVVEESIHSKMWRAVDVMHTWGKNL